MEYVQSPYVVLQEYFGLKADVAFKLSQVFLVLGSPDLASIPWSPRVRVVEFINTFDRNLFEIIFGSGYVSYIEESYAQFVMNLYEYLGKDDFSRSEIVSGRYYGLHNTPRGLLHYGVIYFLVSIWIFFRVHYKSLAFQLSSHYKLANIFIFSMSIWNPSLLFVFLQLTMLNSGERALAIPIAQNRKGNSSHE
jgi:hypothetical protein